MLKSGIRRRSAGLDALRTFLAAESRVLRVKADARSVLDRLATDSLSPEGAAGLGGGGEVGALGELLRASPSAAALLTEVLVRIGLHLRRVCRLNAEKGCGLRSSECGLVRGPPQEFALCQSADAFFYGACSVDV